MDMEVLNDDCWYEIFKYLNIANKIAIFEAYEKFRDVLQAEWQKKFKIIDIETFKCMSILNNAQFCILIENIAPTVESINVTRDYVSRFQLMFSYVFPKTHQITFEDVYSSNLREDVPLMTKAFPNLKILHPYDHFTGKHAIEWQKLEELDITYCSEFQIKYLIQILKELNLKCLALNVNGKNSEFFDNEPEALAKFCQLQAITLDSYGLQWICQAGIQSFHNLKELNIKGCIYTDAERELFRQIGLNRSQDIEILYLLFDIQPLLHGITFENLHKLEVSWVSEAHLEIPQYYKYLPKLNEIFFYHCTWPEPKQLFNFLYMSPQIERITLRECHFEISKLTLNPKEIAKGRSKKLLLTFCKNRYSLDSIFTKQNKNILEIDWDEDSELIIIEKQQQTAENLTLAGMVKIWFR